MSISYTKKIWQNGDLLDAASLNNLESGAGANADAISEIQAALPSYVGSSIARKQAAAYTPGTADQIIGANQYLAGPQTIKGDPDLKAENIKSGVNIFGVDGSYEGSGSGGLTVATGSSTPESGQTIGTIETGLSSIAYLVLYKDSISTTGLVQAVYVASEGNTYMVYCSSYSTYMKSFATGTSTKGTTNGGTFNWGVTNTNTQGMRGGTYNWIAFGAA